MQTVTLNPYHIDFLAQTLPSQHLAKVHLYLVEVFLKKIKHYRYYLTAPTGAFRFGLTQYANAYLSRFSITCSTALGMTKTQFI